MKMFGRNICLGNVSRRLRLTRQLCSGGNHQDEPLRNAQASEIFRSAFFDGVRAENRVSSQDIDDMMASHRARPSLILPIYQVLGSTLGTVARFSPPEYKQVLQNAVQSATVQQFNDSIRTIQAEGNGDVDTKETLKYHRDIETDQPQSTSEQDEAAASSDPFQNISGAKLTVSTALYHFLKLSRSV